MDREKIRQKFGRYYLADRYTYIMGSDKRFTMHLARRFDGYRVLETCTGGGFSTISLARYAAKVCCVEIDPDRMATAKTNMEIAEVSDNIDFFHRDIMDPDIWESLPEFNAAFLDPDWAVSGDSHEFKFIDSNTEPPSDHLFDLIFSKTFNLTLVQPPFINISEYRKLPPHECEFLYFGKHHALTCLHFGEMMRQSGHTRYSISVD